MEKQELPIWAAIDPNGKVVKSSVGTFKAIANRFARNRHAFKVVKLGTVETPSMVFNPRRPYEKTPMKVASTPKRGVTRRGPEPRRRRTKAEMEAVRALQAAAKPSNRSPEHMERMRQIRAEKLANN